MENKHQIISIHGGESFESREEFLDSLKNRLEYDPYKTKQSWKKWLFAGLKDSFECFTPQMPNPLFADYDAWKIWFEKTYPYVKKEKETKIVLIGHSMGGIFLAKYLSENKFPKHIDQLHLVAPVFNNDGLVGESITNFAFDPKNLENIPKQTEKIYLYHSTDDDVVPFEHANKFKEHMPELELVKFNNKQHFNQSSFIEIMQNILKNI